ncbi:hypothetical protein BKA62DRAFT_643772 [Auriculariales sp. MPI-PUGE-AT-0066]|nr:hypothetical protein BKA62DRAFT_643772 [Auriculariales sp. MPI-PUGE-AT-0066]
MSAAAPYDLALSAASPMFSYLPSRDGSQSTTWNASYTGQSLWPPTADTNVPAGIAYRGTNAARVSVSIDFEGTGIWLCYKDNGAGTALTLDSNLWQTTGDVSQLCKPYNGEATAVLAATNLTNGKHKAFLQVVANGGQEFRFFGGGITLAVDTNGKVVDDSQTIDDHDASWVYTPVTGGVWDKGAKGPTLFDNTATFNCLYATDKTATYIFSGASGVIMKGNVWADSHDFSVVLDGATTNMDATSSWLDGSTVLFAKAGLDPTQSHTISLVDYNSDVGPDCRAKYGGRYCCAGLDAITLLKTGTANLPPTSSTGTGSNNGTKTNTPVQSTTSNSSNVGAIAGGVVGGLVAALAIVALAWFFMRRRRHDKDDYQPTYNPGDLGQPMHTDEHAARPAFFAPPTSYAPSVAQSGRDGLYAAGSVMHSDASAPQQYGGMQQVVNPMSPTASMYSQQPVQQHGQPQSPAWLQPVVATGDRKARAGFGAGGTGVTEQSNPSSLYGGAVNGSAPQLVHAHSAGSNSSGGGQQPGGGPRLGQEDLEQVLQFIAQRMDRPGGAAPSSGGARSDVDGDDLPTYQR